MDRMYDEGTARELLRVAGTLDDMIKIDNRGIWPDRSIGYLDQSARELMRWKPAMVLRARDDAPDIINTPGLPFPFTASQLAAFMAHGVGVLLADAFGDWATGPDSDALDMIDVEHNRAREAISAAYATHREARARMAYASDSAPTIDTLVLDLLGHSPGAGESISPRTNDPTARDSETPAEPVRWQVKPVQRTDDLRRAIHEYLQAADKTTDPPTAREMLSAWILKKPAGILKVTRDSVDYLDKNGDSRTSGLDAIAERMARMAERNPAR